MSTEMQSKSSAVSLTRFWAGNDHGFGIQVTSNQYPYPYICLTSKECRTDEDHVIKGYLSAVTDLEHDIILTDLRSFGNNALRESD